MFDPSVPYRSYAITRHSLVHAVDAAIEHHKARYARLPRVLYIPEGGDVTVQDIVRWGGESVVVVQDARVVNRIAVE